jgi:immunity protein Imm1 of predicted polymorphic toxin system
MTDLMVWYDPDREPATTTSPEELRALLDRIQADPEYQDIPTMAQIAAPDGQRVLQIGLGRPDYSVMLWFDKISGEALVSVGLATDDDPAFDFGGTWDEFENGSAIPVTAALNAAREFAATGAKPTAIEWRNRDLSPR